MEECAQVLRGVASSTACPAQHGLTLLSLVRHLARLCLQSARNQLSPKGLAESFSPLLFRTSSSATWSVGLFRSFSVSRSFALCVSLCLFLFCSKSLSCSLSHVNVNTLYCAVISSEGPDLLVQVLEVLITSELNMNQAAPGKTLSSCVCISSFLCLSARLQLSLHLPKKMTNNIKVIIIHVSIVGLNVTIIFKIIYLV